MSVYGLDGKPSGELELPKVFAMFVRPHLIRRAVVANQSHRFQPQGRNPMAGKRTTAQSMGVGHALARVPRVKGERYSRSGQAAFAPSTVGGRLTHPPTSSKKVWKKINDKERKLAFKSAVAATARKDLVEIRGHRVEKVPQIPLIVSDEVQSLKRTVEVRDMLNALGLREDIERIVRNRRERAGIGKMRGRRFKVGVGPLIVVGRDQGIRKAAENLLGVDVIEAKNLNVEHLAPGSHPARLAIWTKSSLTVLEERTN